MEETKKYNIMISYSTRRKEVAIDIFDCLIENKFSVWMAPTSIPEGSDYLDEIYTAIDVSQIVLFVLSEESLSSQWCKHELIYAVGQNKKILPVQITDIDNPYDKMGSISRKLKRTQVFEMFPDYKEKMDNIVEQCKSLFTSKDYIVKPYPRDSYVSDSFDHFVGREKEIEQLHNLILEKRIVNIYGMGGIGKTKLIKKYYETYVDKAAYHSIHIASVSISIKETIARIPFAGFDENEYLNKLPQSKEYSIIDALYEQKMKFLQQLTTECLLVIDGADYLSENEMIPLATIGCAVVITSRNRYSCFVGFELKAMNDAQLMKMFFSYSKLEQSQENVDSISRIIKRVGYHTLTIKLIACYCYDMGMTPKELEEENLISSLSEFDSELEKVSTLFNFSNLDEQELYTMRVLTLFPNGVTKGKLQKFDKMALRKCNELSLKGWVQTTDTTVSLHQIVQQSIIDNIEITTDNIRPFLSSFVNTFRNIGFNNTELLVIVRRIVEVVKGNDYLQVTLLHHIGNFVGDITYANTFHVLKETYEGQDMNFYNRKNEECAEYEMYDESFNINQKALNLALSQKNRNHKQIAYIYSYMGSACFNKNEFDKALEYQLKAYNYAIEHNVEQNSCEFIVILNRIGLTALETKAYDVAHKAFIAYKEVVNRYDIPNGNKAMADFNLGNLMLIKDNYLEAEKYYLSSLQLNKDDVSTSFGISELFMNMAYICRITNRLTEAKDYYLKAKEIKKNIITDKDVLNNYFEKYDRVYL